MNKSLAHSLFCFLTLSVALAAPAQQAETEQPQAEQTTDPAATKAAFDQAFADYKQLIREFESLRTEYQTASPDRRDAINAELRGYFNNMREKVSGMIDAALEAYKADPNGDAQVQKLLLDVAAQDIRGVGPDSQGGDNYERAYAVITALIDGGLAEEHKELPLWGIIAAFATNHFDKADEFKLLAAKSGSFGARPDAKDNVGSEVFSVAMQYAQMIDQYRKLWTAEEAIRKAEAAADDLPRVKMSTSKGDIVFEMFENEAPEAVANFLTLTKDGYYDGVPFHRVLPRFMAQGGDPTGTGTGGPGYNIRCECYKPEARHHFRGSLSMAHAGRDTGGSQFFLTFVPTSHLDGRHTVFGRVIEGMDVLAELQRVDPSDRGAERDQIVKAEVLRDRGHAYEFEKLPGR